jgi:micrococcal nuclease
MKIPQAYQLLLFPLLLTLTPIAPTSAKAIAQTTAATVLSVGDGDTIRVKSADGKNLTVRLACIDAPESAQAPYGQASANRLKQLLPVGTSVSLRIADTDRYGRSVAKIYRDGLSINVALVQEGHAAVYSQYLGACPELREKLMKAEASAKTRRIGFWAQSNPIMPWDYRRTAKTTAVKPTTTMRRPAAAVVSDRPSQRPAGDYDCKDFRSQPDAQAMFDRYVGDPFGLDRDRDGVACESLK